MGWLQRLLGIQPITFEGGNGETMETAVIIRGARGSLRGVPAEYRYLGERFGQRNVDWMPVEQTLLHSEEGKSYDLVRIELKDGRQVDVYIDISEFYGRF